eukprot:jgi/Picre1/32357/NNA_007703.t1
MSYFAPTKFVWRLGGNQVHLCGSFTRWVETVPMVPEDGQPGVFSVIVHLPPGYHQYKFIVDGEWRHDEAQPFMPDPLGNVNNWLFVRKPEIQNTEQTSSQTGNLQEPSSQAFDNTGFLKDSAYETTDAFTKSQGAAASVALEQEKEPFFSKGKIKEFLAHHTASELIPESGKVVLLDIDLPLRQAFHALHEQGTASAPLFDTRKGSICGIISATDFITTLQQMRNLVSTSSNPMSEAEMDQHTIRGLREELAIQGRSSNQLISIAPNDTLQDVVNMLLKNHCSLAPIVNTVFEPVSSEETQEVLHNATLGGVLGCLLRHFRSSLASLPLLARPLDSLPIGTWSQDSTVVVQEASNQSGTEVSMQRKVANLVTVKHSTPLYQAFSMLLEGGFSCLPVVNDAGVLVDIYAKSDITMLAKSNAYSRLQFEDVTVGQVLALASQPSPPSLLSNNTPQTWEGASPSASQTSIQDNSSVPGKQRIHACTNSDPLKTVVERLSIPGVRRLLVVNPETKKLEGIISLSDIASFLLT